MGWGIMVVYGTPVVLLLAGLLIFFKCSEEVFFRFGMSLIALGFLALLIFVVYFGVKGLAS